MYGLTGIFYSPLHPLANAFIFWGFVWFLYEWLDLISYVPENWGLGWRLFNVDQFVYCFCLPVYWRASVLSYCRSWWSTLQNFLTDFEYPFNPQFSLLFVFRTNHVQKYIFTVSIEAIYLSKLTNMFQTLGSFFQAGILLASLFQQEDALIHIQSGSSS